MIINAEETERPARSEATSEMIRRGAKRRVLLRRGVEPHEERIDECYCLVASLLVGRSATIIIALSLRSSSLRLACRIVFITNAHHHQQVQMDVRTGLPRQN